MSHPSLAPTRPPVAVPRPLIGRLGAGRLRGTGAGLLLLFPEITVGLLLFTAVRQLYTGRLAGQDRERGDAIQWVIVTAIGAAIAVTVGAIIFTKVEGKANQIDVTTPGAR